MTEHPQGFRRIEARRPGHVPFTVNGRPASAPEGEPLAVALAVLGCLALRSSPGLSGPRGAFCFMAVCQECMVRADGVRRQACLTPVAAGMVVELGDGA